MPDRATVALKDKSLAATSSRAEPTPTPFGARSGRAEALRKHLLDDRLILRARCTHDELAGFPRTCGYPYIRSAHQDHVYARKVGVHRRIG